MPDEGIGTRVSILGDKEYKAALSDINRSLAVLNSSMDASQSAFKGQENSMEALRDRSQRLQAVYDAQKQKIELIAAQLAKAKQEYGENSKQADALQIALNRATKQMNLTGAEIDKTNAAMEEAGNAGSEMTQGVQDAGKAVQDEGKQAKTAEVENSKLKEAMGKAGEVAEKALAAGCKAAAAAMGAMAAAAAAGVKAAFDMAQGAGTYADDLLTLSTQTGISAKSLQEWSYASNFVDTSVERVSDSMKDLSKHMAEGFADSSGSAYKNFVQLGVSIKDFDGNMRGTEDVFWDAIDALHNMEAGAERDALAMSLFGDSARELNPLIEAGSAAFKGMSAEAAQMGVVFSDEALAAMGSFDDSMQRVKQSSEGLKNAIGLTLIPAFQPLVDAATTAMADVSRALQDGVTPEELPGILDGFLRVVDSTLTDVVGLIEGALPIVSEAVTQVVSALAGKLPGLLTKLLPAAMGLLKSLVDAIKANVQPIAELATSLVTSLAGFLAESGSDLAEAAVQLVDGLLDGIIGALPELIPAGIQLVASLASGLLSGIPKLLAKLPEIVGAIWDGLTNVDWGKLGGEVLTALLDGLKALGDSLGKLFSDGLQAVTGLSWGDVGAAITSGIGDIGAWLSGLFGSGKDGAEAID